MKNLLLLAAPSLAFCQLTAFAGETEWPQFRGPTGQGLSAAVQVPVEWSATKGVKWKVEVPGRGWSSPVLARGRLYLTTAGGDSDTTLRALCLDATDGRVIWNTEVFRPDPASLAAMHKKNSPASGSPIVTADRLYVHFGHMGTAALDLEGKVVWRQTEVKYPPVHGTGGSPLLTGGALVFSCDGEKDPFVTALDAGTGAIRWKTARNTKAKRPFSFCTPLAIEVAGASQIILPGAGFVGSYDGKDGREIWRVSYGEGYSVIPRPVFAHGLLFVSSSFDAAVLYAIKPDGAAGDATATNVAWSSRKAAPHSASTLVLGDEIYFVSDAGIATCADARTGAVHWSERLSGGFSASPVAAEGRVYFQNEAGVSFVVQAGKTYQLLATNDLGERTLASPAVADGALYLRSEKHLWKIAP
ncbi:MAG: PQQ-binding-like beta-propeller repeat protein [Verrucomicrobia bacterium]|nr:MAG: PQQ-binding-like beta-propeller repeat protein [Verrucomicrobiota bacterium]